MTVEEAAAAAATCSQKDERMSFVSPSSSSHCCVIIIRTYMGGGEEGSGKKKIWASRFFFILCLPLSPLASAAVAATDAVVEVIIAVERDLMLDSVAFPPPPPLPPFRAMNILRSVWKYEGLSCAIAWRGKRRQLKRHKMSSGENSGREGGKMGFVTRRVFASHLRQSTPTRRE